MSNYSKVQFISWEVHTGPFVIPGTAKGNPDVALYSGLLDPAPDKRTDALGQCWDIDARLAFTADAISKAELSSDRSPGTLKVFMAPEFLYRGAGGAYLHDLIDGWASKAPAEFNLPAPYSGPWPGLFGGLRALVRDAKYEDWIFVFGTAVSASFPSAKQGNGKFVIDTSKPGEIYNSALIQRGGLLHGGDNYVSRKHYISGIDFLNWNASVKQHVAGTVLPLDPSTVLPADVLGVPEGGAVFRIPGINDSKTKPIDFGIEICLDHIASGSSANAYGRLRTAGQFVRIQLVPSGGMRLKPESICLQPAGVPTPRSYAFNCDGLGNIDGSPGSHTQLWNGTNGAIVLPANRLVDANGGVALADTRLSAVITQVRQAQVLVSADMLWNSGGSVKGAGQVRLLATRDL